MADKPKDTKKDSISKNQDNQNFSKVLSLDNKLKVAGKPQIKKILNRSESVTVEIKKRRGTLGLSNIKEDKKTSSPSSDLTAKLDLIRKANRLAKETQLKKASSEATKNTLTLDKNTSTEASIESKKQPNKEIKLSPAKNYKPQEEDKQTSDPDNKKDFTKAKHSSEKRRDSNRIVIQNINFNDDDVRGRSVASFRRKLNKNKRSVTQVTQPKEKISREIILPEHITVVELASRMTEKATDVVKKFLDMGMAITSNQTVDADTAELIANAFGHKVKRVKEADVENILFDDENEDKTKLTKRPPVVTVMGHIDHGKTSLLDALRATDITSGEAGGITQHIGAYQVQLKNGEKITFLDTPGHEIFTEMRLRGAMTTDIVILVIAADDGIKDQTIEAISHAKAAKVPIIVAINKIDAIGADVQKINTELLSHELIPESMGGDIMTVEVSALKKQNLDKLEEAILFQAELLELKANENGRTRGVAIESKMDKAKGSVATLLVQNGTLQKGNIIVVGHSFGKIRTMINDKGAKISTAPPSTPIEITGLNTAPEAGEPFYVVKEEKQAREICDYRLRKQKETKFAKPSSVKELFEKSSTTNGNKTKEFPIIIKGDVQGSIEAIANSIAKLSTDKVKATILHKGVGSVNESDVSLAKSFNAIIIGFNVPTTNPARISAQNENIEIKNYSIIYQLIDEVKLLMEGKLDTIKKEKYIGRVEVRKIFIISRIGTIGGALVTDGVIKRNAIAKLSRNNNIIYEGTIKTLKRTTDDAKQIEAGHECGFTLDKYNDIKEGDIVDIYEIIEEKDKL
ncbi:MAG: translation initiation factor IF-2 [Rickettsiales bacterium]|nr:translation initiation factor IF-2 [Rickettsiales bacterium]